MIKKNIKNIGSIAKKAAGNIGEVAATGAKKGIEAASDKYSKAKYNWDMKKYNPLFWDEYNSPDFDRPNMVMIVDDAQRRDVEVAEGAIGWREDSGGMEILCLYDTKIEESGIVFIPEAVCDSIYYVDRFDENRYIRIDDIFTRSHNEKIAELKHIAHSLGAKRYSVEIIEETKSLTKKAIKKQVKNSNKIKGVKLEENASATAEEIKGTYNRRSGQSNVKFAGSDNPVRPELKWFRHDDIINRLIDMRMDINNPIKSDSLILQGSSSATMTQAMAKAIDATVSKIGIKGTTSMQTEAENEKHTKLKFDIEF